MIKVRCKECGKEVISNSARSVSCGCPNMTTIRDDSITAVDLSQVIMVQSGIHNNDILIVDRSIEPRHTKIVVVALDGQMTVKRLYRRQKKTILMRGFYLKISKPTF